MNRRKILCELIVIGFMFLFSNVVFSTSQQLEFFNQEIVLGPYTQNVNNESIIIVWETDIPTTDNRVEYGETSSYGYVEYGVSNTDHHEVTIHPLFTSGHYRVVSDGVESIDLEFKLTSHCYSTKEFTCVLYGDSRGVWDNWNHATQVANAINTEHPDFVIHLGDMVKNGTIESEWTSWLDLMNPLMQNSTVFGVLGNHENNGDRYFEIFALPNNEKWYSFDYGPCHFTILDQYEYWGILSPQYKWLKNDLSSTNKPFKIVCFHEPIFCSEGQGHPPRVDIRTVWEPLFNSYDVNLVFQSHNHNYQRTNPINGITYVVSGGGGAPLYIPGNAGFINNSKMGYQYCILNVSLDTNEITVSAKGTNGETFDEFVIYPSQPGIPNLEVTKPKNALYLFNFEIRPYLLRKPLIIGKIDIEVNASQDQLGMDKVEFYIDGELEATDLTEPYSWTWHEAKWNETVVFFRHTIESFAYDIGDNIAFEGFRVWRFF